MAMGIVTELYMAKRMMELFQYFMNELLNEKMYLPSEATRGFGGASGSKNSAMLRPSAPSSSCSVSSSIAGELSLLLRNSCSVRVF